MHAGNCPEMYLTRALTRSRCGGPAYLDELVGFRRHAARIVEVAPHLLGRLAHQGVLAIAAASKGCTQVEGRQSKEP